MARDVFATGEFGRGLNGTSVLPVWNTKAKQSLKASIVLFTCCSMKVLTFVKLLSKQWKWRLGRKGSNFTRSRTFIHIIGLKSEIPQTGKCYILATDHRLFIERISSSEIPLGVPDRMIKSLSGFIFWGVVPGDYRPSCFDPPLTAKLALGNIARTLYVKIITFPQHQICPVSGCLRRKLQICPMWRSTEKATHTRLFSFKVSVVFADLYWCLFILNSYHNLVLMARTCC